MGQTRIFIGSQGNWVCKRSGKASSPTHPQSMTSCGTWPGCSGLDPVKSWNPPRLETVQGGNSSSASLSWWGTKFFLISSLSCSCFSFCSLTVTVPQWAIVKSMALSLDDLPVGNGRSSWVPSKQPLLQPEQAPVLKPLFPGHVLQPLIILMPLFWTCSTLSKSSLAWVEVDWMQYLRYNPTSAE